ncbi:hypothetical protein ACFLV1_02180 [Chloroflexota bacterium]
MKFKDILGGSKEPAMEAKVEPIPEPVVKDKAKTKWRPRVNKAAAKRAKRKKRF